MTKEVACLPLNIIYGAPNGKYTFTASVLIKGDEIYFDNQNLKKTDQISFVLLLLFILITSLVVTWFNRPSVRIK